MTLEHLLPLIGFVAVMSGTPGPNNLMLIAAGAIHKVLPPAGGLRVAAGHVGGEQGQCSRDHLRPVRELQLLHELVAVHLNALEHGKVRRAAVEGARVRIFCVFDDAVIIRVDAFQQLLCEQPHDRLVPAEKSRDLE